MNKGIVRWFSFALITVASYTTSASEVAISHSFSSGTPAIADEVNQNFSDVKAAVDDNHARISTNEGSVASNSTAISNNTTAINALDVSVIANTDAVNSNALSIDTNRTLIDSNSARISANETTISTHAQGIDTNTQSIESNTQSIAAINQAVNIYDRIGNRLGRFITVAPWVDSNYSKSVHQGTVAWLLSDSGYLFALQRWYGLSIAQLSGIKYFQVPTTLSDFVISNAKLYYDTNNCTGQAYISDSQLESIAYTGFSPVLSVRGGLVFKVVDQSGTLTAYYLPKGSSAGPIEYASTRDWDTTTCTPNTPSLLEFARPVLPNDVSVTGVKSDPDYAWPLTIDY